MTANRTLQCQIHLPDAQIDATTWSLADTEHVTNQLEREIHDITSNEQKQFKQEFSIRLIKFEAWWETSAFRRCGKPLNKAQHILNIR